MTKTAHIPSGADLTEKLAPMTWAQLRKLATDANVPFTTLWKLRIGATTNPRVETVTKLWPHLVRPSK
jgi:predicted transcriptional regulator